MSNNDFTFTITSPIDTFESLGPSKLILRGIFIRLNIPTRNGRIYQVEEGEQIASDLLGKDLYIGADIKGLHKLDERHKIGKVVESVCDKVKEIITGAVEVWNTIDFPDLISKIKEGWGFSIGGKIKDFKFLGKLNERLLPIIRAIGMKATHLQLLEPQEKRGDTMAMVSEVIPVMESLEIDPAPFANITIGEAEMLREVLLNDLNTKFVTKEEHDKALDRINKLENPQPSVPTTGDTNITVSLPKKRVILEIITTDSEAVEFS